MSSKNKGDGKTLYEQFYVMDVVLGALLFISCIIIPLVSENHVVRLNALSVGMFLSIWEALSAWRLSESKGGVMNPWERQTRTTAKYAPWNVILGITAALIYYFILKQIWI